MRKLKSIAKFKKELNDIHPDLKLIGEYKHSNLKVIVEDKLGIQYKVKPYNLLIGN